MAPAATSMGGRASRTCGTNPMCRSGKLESHSPLGQGNACSWKRDVKHVCQPGRTACKNSLPRFHLGWLGFDREQRWKTIIQDAVVIQVSVYLAEECRGSWWCLTRCSEGLAKCLNPKSNDYDWIPRPL